jgi:hypothetical protein
MDHLNRDHPTGDHLPPQLDDAITRLVDQAADHALGGVDQAKAVDQLVATSRWNPALLMVAATRAGQLADRCGDDRYDPAVESLQAAEAVVRTRAY